MSSQGLTRAQKRWLVAGLVVAVIALLALLYSKLEWHEVEIDRGFRGEARRNPLLAAERTLARLGHEVESRPLLGALPETDSLVVLRQSSRFLSPLDIERLVDWVDAGGHLVLLLPADEEFAAQLDDDIEQERADLPLLEALDITIGKRDGRLGLQTLDLGRGPRELDVEGAIDLRDPYGHADALAGDAMEARAIDFGYGEGRVTVFAGDTWMSNRQLGDHEHARVLEDLVLANGSRRTLLVFSEDPPGLLTLLWEHGWTAVLGLAALVAIALWRRALALGPREPELERDRRDFSEHVEAAGEFLWRVGASRSLLAAPHEELRRKLALVRPDLAPLERTELAAQLAQASGLEPARVEHALATEETRDTAEFETVVRDLETLRRSL